MCVLSLCVIPFLTLCSWPPARSGFFFTKSMASAEGQPLTKRKKKKNLVQTRAKQGFKVHPTRPWMNSDSIWKQKAKRIIRCGEVQTASLGQWLFPGCDAWTVYSFTLQDASLNRIKSRDGHPGLWHRIVMPRNGSLNMILQKVWWWNYCEETPPPPLQTVTWIWCECCFRSGFSLENSKKLYSVNLGSGHAFCKLM